MRKLLTATAVAVLIAASAAPSSAAVIVYLVSRAELSKAPALGDVASIDAAPGIRNMLLNLAIPEKALSDGYVDRREVEDLLAAAVSEGVLVYGNAVRVNRMVREEPAAQEGSAVVSEQLVRTGDAVNVRVKNNGIIIELSGNALQGGARGDEVAVKLKGNRTLKGRVVQKSLIELAL
ncbi:MAG TPA: flagella basal body P-ring formation protein FlgA [Spirochaetota bacterium]|nr:flagella basal body P-ring formation protein FlgA [Spirochaetota bacterium]